MPPLRSWALLLCFIHVLVCCTTQGCVGFLGVVFLQHCAAQIKSMIAGAQHQQSQLQRESWRFGRDSILKPCAVLLHCLFVPALPCDSSPFGRGCCSDPRWQHCSLSLCSVCEVRAIHSTLAVHGRKQKLTRRGKQDNV